MSVTTNDNEWKKQIPRLVPASLLALLFSAACFSDVVKHIPEFGSPAVAILPALLSYILAPAFVAVLASESVLSPWNPRLSKIVSVAIAIIGGAIQLFCSTYDTDSKAFRIAWIVGNALFAGGLTGWTIALAVHTAHLRKNA